MYTVVIKKKCQTYRLLSFFLDIIIPYEGGIYTGHRQLLRSLV